MPWSAPRHCPHGHKAFTGRSCPECAKAGKRRAERFRDKAAKALYTAAWSKTSKAYIAKHSTCVACGKPSQCVDHIIAHKGDRKLFWNSANWQPMCIPCNSRKAAKEEGAFGRPIGEGDQGISQQSPRERCGGAARKTLKIGYFE